MPARIMTASCAVKPCTSRRPGPSVMLNCLAEVLFSSAGASARMYSPLLRIIWDAAARLWAAITPVETWPAAFRDSNR